MADHTTATVPGLSSAALDALVSHDWPGNVRELRNAIQRAVVMAEDGELTASDFSFLRPASPQGQEPEAASGLSRWEQAERTNILGELARQMGNKSKTARVLGIDSLTDIAVLKIDVSTKPIPIGNSDSLNTGQWVIAIGSPMGLQNSVTSGIVSAVGRHTTFTSDLYVDYVQTDAPINPGNSSGALIDLDGQLIGMNTLILTPNSENIGIGFAIPSNLIAWVAESIIKTGHVRRGWLGVDLQAIDPDLANALDLQSAEGALIARVQPKSPAEEAGLQNGDVVLAFNGRDIHSIHELRNMVAHSAPHKSVECKILRQGKKLAIKAVMGARNN